MEIINNYEVFREHCSTFSQRYIDTYLSEGQLVCHPYVKDLIFAPCSEEEAKRNDNTICRLKDMMLMSEDGSTGWKPFDLMQARETASVNEHIYLSDLLFTECFVAHDWMIDGKHDQLLVSESYMREHNKPYAPVTPLTNQKLKIKKIINSEFWKKGTAEEPVIIDFEKIQESLGEYVDDKIADFPVIADISEIRMPVFGMSAEVGKNTARKITAEKALEDIADLKTRIDRFIPLIRALGFNMTVSGYAMKYIIAALKKNGVEINAAEFRNDYFNPVLEKLPEDHTEDDELEALKEAFFDAYSKNNSCGFVYNEDDFSAYAEKLREIELIKTDKTEHCRLLSALVSEKPADRLVFRIMRSVSSADKENIDNIEEFWLGETAEVSDEEVNAHLSASYVSECRDDDGKLNCGAAQAKLVLDDVTVAASKYHMRVCEPADELKAYIDRLDKAARTYNGTVFESPADMEKAMKNELELSKLCADLSALDESELKKLRSYIFNMTADDRTKGKYLLKVRIAMNECDENALAHMCLGLPLMDLNAAAELKKKIETSGFDETVSAPYIKAAENRMVSAQADELLVKYADLETMTEPQIDELIKETDTDRYDRVLKKHFLRRANTAKENILRRKYDEMCAGMEKMDKEQLAALKTKVSENSGSSRTAASYIHKIDVLINDYDRREVSALFAGISKADRERIAKLRAVINEGKYDTVLTDPYIIQIADRERAIDIEEFTARCDKIPDMDVAGLAVIETELLSRKYGDDISEKYLAMVKERRIAIEKQEIAELCKNIASSDNEALDKLETVLKGDRFEKEYTADYIEKIKERRNELEKAEIADICKDIGKADKAALKAISDKISDEKYNKEYTAEYFEKIRQRDKELDNMEAAELAKGIPDMDRAALKVLSEKLQRSFNSNKKFYMFFVKSIDVRFRVKTSVHNEFSFSETHNIEIFKKMLNSF